MTKRHVVVASAMALLLATFLLGCLWIAQLPELPARETTARIIGISGVPTRTMAPRTRITAQSDDGAIGEVYIGSAIVTCSIGDRVRARKIGIVLELEPSACNASEVGFAPTGKP